MVNRKTLYWVGTSLDDLKAFPQDGRAQAGHQINLVQTGQEPGDWKPMTTVGTGVREIRIKDDANAYRIFYMAVTDSGVYVLHAFRKTSQKTKQRDINKGKERYKEVMRSK